MRTVIICGSRTWTDEGPIRNLLDSLPSHVMIVSGGARGADSIVWRLAEQLGLMATKYLAEWETYGRAAGPIRNARMLEVEKPDHVYAFRMPGRSPGTDDLIRQARQAGITVTVIGPPAPGGGGGGG